MKFFPRKSKEPQVDYICLKDLSSKEALHRELSQAAYYAAKGLINQEACRRIAAEEKVEVQLTSDQEAQWYVEIMKEKDGRPFDFFFENSAEWPPVAVRVTANGVTEYIIRSTVGEDTVANYFELLRLHEDFRNKRGTFAPQANGQQQNTTTTGSDLPVPSGTTQQQAQSAINQPAATTASTGTSTAPANQQSQQSAPAPVSPNAFTFELPAFTWPEGMEGWLGFNGKFQDRQIEAALQQMKNPDYRRGYIRELEEAISAYDKYQKEQVSKLKKAVTKKEDELKKPVSTAKESLDRIKKINDELTKVEEDQYKKLREAYRGLGMTDDEIDRIIDQLKNGSSPASNPAPAPAPANQPTTPAANPAPASAITVIPPAGPTPAPAPVTNPAPAANPGTSMPAMDMITNLIAMGVQTVSIPSEIINAARNGVSLDINRANTLLFVNGVCDASGTQVQLQIQAQP